MPLNRFDNPSVHSYIIKKIYCASLLQFPQKEFLNLWTDAWSIVSSRFSSLKEFLAVLYEKEFYLPWEIFCLASDFVEKTAVSMGLDPIEFAGKHVFSIDGGTLLPPFRSLEIVDSMLKTFFSSEPREALLDLIEKINPITSPGTSHKIYDRVTVNGIRKIHTVFDVDSRHFPSFTMMFTNVCSESFSKCLGFPPFESCRVVSEMRTVQDVESLYGELINKDSCRQPFTEVAFGEFLDRNEIPKPSHPDLKKKVQCIDRDVRDEAGNIVLKRGTCYGAPCAILQMCFKPEPSRPISIRRLLESIVSRDKDHSINCKMAHKRVQKCLDDRYVFTFVNSLGALYLNKRLISKGAPARVISKVINAYVNTGRNTFTNEFFLTDNSIIRNKFDKSLNITLKRAQRALAVKAPLVLLHRNTGEGVIRLQVNCDISFSDSVSQCIPVSDCSTRLQ